MRNDAFTPEAAAALGGPAWLARRRADALAGFAGRELPTEAEEEWHYSKVSDLNLGAFSPPLPPARPDAVAVSGELPEAASRLLAELGPIAGLVVTRDGAVERLEASASAVSAGATVASLAGEATEPAALPSLADAPDALWLLAEAFVADGALVRLPARAVVEEPFVVIHWMSGASASRLVAPRTLVELGEGAQASVVELLVSGDEAILVAPSVELRVGDGAHLSAMSVQQLGGGAVQLASQRSVLGRDAVLVSFVAALGGAVTRQRTHSVLAGVSAESRHFAIYLADDHQAMSFRTVQEHVAAHTRSELVFKGAVAGEARSAYSGLVRIHRGARKADASQTNRNLVLSDGARADSVPNLDIEENDVRCSHASAVGPIDPEQRFYLETRGVPSEAAERLVLLGFFEELLARAPITGFAAHVRDGLPGRLAAAAGALVEEPVLAPSGGAR